MTRLIFVADDEPDLRDLLVEVLTDAGYAVKAFPDAPSLIAAASGESPELILLDINMPGMTGWEAQRRLRERPELARTRYIAVTAQGGAVVETSAIRTLEFHAFVRKPFKLAELLACVESALAPSAPPG